MKIVKYMQQGGPMPTEQGAPMPAEAPAQGGMDQQLQQIAGQLLDSLMQATGGDPNATMAILQMAMDMLSQAAQAPMGSEPQEAQFYRKGGKVCVKRCGGAAKKPTMKCGGKTKKSKKC